MKINNTEINVPLLNKAFDHTKWHNKDKIDSLIKSIERIETIIEKYLNAITTDFPQLTDHSIEHSRMLWNYANLITGPDYSLNPLEAFVLHIVFLIHDSGMCYSILNNKEVLEQDIVYLDYLREHGESKKDDALFYTVRERHGDFALKIAKEKLRDDEFLIEDIQLREELGLFIGKIAKSHSCNIGYIEREFGSTKYGSPKFPVDWLLDSQKLSFILRVSDAAHIDSLRTPKTNKMIAEIEGVSKEHWTFQKKLGFPTLSEDNLLIYSSNTPFFPQEQKAWWFCYDALKVLDRELRNANEYFEIKSLVPFKAKGVKSINDTLNLGKEFVRTEGWSSIDTQVKVSNPIHIASELGGEKLYGDKSLAIREIIQNSIDAINLYRIQSGQNNMEVGLIKVSLELIENNYYLIITDNGIGMSQTLMTNELLDFGNSFWKSGKFNYEYGGAKLKGFESIGKYGIGFFSTFMLGQEVSVTSWKFGESINEMKTLSFYDGLSSNPILRAPLQDEKNRIIDRGTSVKIKLDCDPKLEKGLLVLAQDIRSLFDIVKSFVLAANVKILIVELDKSEKILTPEFLYQMNTKEIINFLFPQKRESVQGEYYRHMESLTKELIEIRHDDKYYGKLALLPSSLENAPPVACVLSKGIVVTKFKGFAGYIISDEVVSIKRDNYKKVVPYEALRVWALKQMDLLGENMIIRNAFPLLDLKLAFGLYDSDTIILLEKKNNKYTQISIGKFKEIISKRDEFSLYQEGYTASSRTPDCDGFIIFYIRLNFNNLIKEDDKNLLKTYIQIIEENIAEVWGKFEKIITEIDNRNILNAPYIGKDQYVRQNQNMASI